MEGWGGGGEVSLWCLLWLGKVWTLGLHSTQRGSLSVCGATAPRTDCQEGRIAGSARVGRASPSTWVRLLYFPPFLWKTAHSGRNSHILRKAATPLIWLEGPIKVVKMQLLCLSVCVCVLNVFLHPCIFFFFFWLVKWRVEGLKRKTANIPDTEKL